MHRAGDSADPTPSDRAVTYRLARQLGRIPPGEPRQHGCPHVGEQTVVAPPLAAGVRRQQWHVLARVIGVGRGRVDAMVGSQDQQVVGAELAIASRQRRRSISMSASRKPRNVVPMPIHLVGLDQVHEDQPRIQLAK